jgi:protoporphyrinogen oxidase
MSNKANRTENHPSENKRILIIGAGPTGLGAAWRLQELGYKNWEIYEKNSYVGGLSASFTDNKGFTYDIGGHVIFSHYNYFDQVMEKVLKEKYLTHQRNSWIWLKDRFIPYPFQNNIRYLPKDKVIRCLVGLAETMGDTRKAGNFREWIEGMFGDGIARYFLLPYNRKQWSYPLEKMAKDWIAERVSVVDFKRILENVLHDRDDIEWGPNACFHFPLHGGTGGLYKSFIPYIKDKLHLDTEVCRVDSKNKKIELSNGSWENYDFLINTMPLDELADRLYPSIGSLSQAINKLKFNQAYIVGVGIARPCPSNKCWMYFPEKTSPFYRVTYLSNYSPNMVPDKNHFILLTETTHSSYKKVPRGKIVDMTLEGLVNVKLLEKDDLNLIASIYVIEIDHCYPVPSLKRDEALAVIHPYLESTDIYSRGRFGGWLYEIGNMDHSLMQGVELINRLLLGKKEKVWHLPQK